MEAEETSRKSWSPSHDTALCLIPPQDLWPAINALRCFNDKAYGKWPPHINLVYPFVQPAVLDQTANILTQIDFSSYNDLTVSLSETGTFVHDKHNTIYLKPKSSQLSALANALRKAVGWPAENLTPHLTVAQSEDVQSSSHKFMLEKARLITPLKWQAAQLAIMVRDQDQDADGLRRMRIWKCIDLQTKSLVDLQSPQEEVIPTDKGDSSRAYQRTSYQYSSADGSWSPLKETEIQPEETPLDRLIIASYNVLAEFHWPPDTSRNPKLISNLLSTRAAADILVLQEVSDHFIPDLLSNVDICNRYPFSTHAPASSGAGPLTSLLNVVILSKFPVKWEYLPLQKRHKGATIAIFPTVTFNGQPLVVAGCHLTQGLVDGAITAKKIELLRLMRYLADKYSESARLMVGDFNLTTSSYTIDLAQRRQALSSNGKQTLDDVNEILTGSEMQDVWLVTRLESGESSTSAVAQDAIMNLYEGEQGATFDPLTNTLTASLVGSGLNNRPQRYDRILFNKSLPLHPTGFNMFGQDPMEANEKGVQYHASDHWGIRCLFTKTVQPDAAITAKTKPVELFEAPESLGGIEDLKKVLFAKGCLPAEADETTRALALKTLENALLRPANEQDNRSVGLVLVPVGSYGLGVWMSSSDVDCLCIGTISSRTFFTMALQRLRKATAQGITVLRRVKANSGTMLELDVQGIKFDLQYCPATNIVEGYPEILNYPSTHPAFSLPIQTLSKLKPARDMSYLRRSIPDLAKFRVAFLCIKAWAMSRGLYGAKFGFLGGIHIDVLLAPVCKALAKTSSAVSTTDIVTTFFHHYATFDWQTQMVFDPFFHKDIKYHRTSREPMCLLGWHAPALNTAMTASVPTVKTIALEIARADEILSKEGATWDALLDAKTSIQGSKDFLVAYKSYVKIDARFWGSSSTQGRRFLGWLESRCVAILVGKFSPTLSIRNFTNVCRYRSQS